VNLKEVIEKVKKVLEREDRVLVAVVYGSATRRERVRDIDIAIYAKPDMPLREFLRIEAELEREIGVPVDLVPLDRVPPELAYKALTSGVKAVSRSPVLYSALVAQVLAHMQDVQIKLSTVKRPRTLARGVGSRGFAEAPKAPDQAQAQGGVRGEPASKPVLSNRSGKTN